VSRCAQPPACIELSFVRSGLDRHLNVLHALIESYDHREDHKFTNVCTALHCTHTLTHTHTHAHTHTHTHTHTHKHTPRRPRLVSTKQRLKLKMAMGRTQQRDVFQHGVTESVMCLSLFHQGWQLWRQCRQPAGTRRFKTSRKLCCTRTLQCMAWRACPTFETFPQRRRLAFARASCSEPGRPRQPRK
jgi:hypothetical protein